MSVERYFPKELEEQRSQAAASVGCQSSGMCEVCRSSASAPAAPQAAEGSSNSDKAQQTA